MENLANTTCGWASDLPSFSSASLDEVVNALTDFVRESTPEQIRAWRKSIKPLQQQSDQIVKFEPTGAQYGAILEYIMPEGMHRADAILLISGAVLVIELKGDGVWQPEYLEQVADYARRLFWFHTLCGAENIKVHTVLVSYGREIEEEQHEWHTRANLGNLLDVVRRFDRPNEARPIPVAEFIQPLTNQPSLSLVQAARRYFAEHALPHIKRIDAITSGAIEECMAAIRSAHAKQSRCLILLSGVPGAGKTFVGLKIAHEPTLENLAETLPNGEKVTVPAVFLSGNGPLVEVLQYELKRAGGGGRVFVRGVKDFVRRYSSKRASTPPHHVLIFDEAQRAWDSAKVRESHDDVHAMSEPEAFIQFAERITGWSVVIALIGDGQEIHTGEEGGIGQWADAVAHRPGWSVMGPPRLAPSFSEKGLAFKTCDSLHLATSVRFNFAAGLSDWAAELVSDNPSSARLQALAMDLRAKGYQLRITRNLQAAKEFLWGKYRHLPEARFGILMSSRDRDLAKYGLVQNRFLRPGPWYGDPEDSPSSCRRLQDPATEFAAQGLELDHVLLAWGSDFVLEGQKWSNANAKRYKKHSVKDPMQLRRNAYRVLLTRGREGVLLCLPQGIPALDQTFDFLTAAGCEKV